MVVKPAYYNEIDPFACEWLRNLIEAGHIPAGDVDERDIRSVQPDDLAGYGQKHLFAGLGGFAHACRLAGLPDDFDVLTGGFPCQPFSVAGRQLAQSDDRHLWPEMCRLVASLRPAWVLGENVAGLVGLALDGVCADLETDGFACRAVIIPACAVDAPHRRDRVWIIAKVVDDAAGARCGGAVEHAAGVGRGEGRAEPELRSGRATAAGSSLPHGDVANAVCAGRVSGAQPGVHRGEEGPGPRDGEPQRRGVAGDVGHANGEGSQVGHGVTGDARQERPAALGAGWRSPWADSEYREGADGKVRRVEPGIRLLAHGVPARVAKLRAFGNAICPQTAAEILKAMLEHRAC